MVQRKGEVENLQLRLLDCYHIGRAPEGMQNSSARGGAKIASVAAS